MNQNVTTIDKSYFFNKKTSVSFFLSFLVVLIHVHSFDGYVYSGRLGNALSFFGDYITSGVTGVAIRLFFVISGVLFYRNYTYNKTINKYKSRIRTLVIPYLIWSVFYTVLLMLINLTPLKNLIAVDAPITLKNILLGTFLNYYYKSFWFIFNLIIFTLFCPLFYTFLKNKYIGASIIFIIIALYSFGIKIPETIMISGNEYVVFWKADSIIFYMLGAYIGIHYFDWFAKKRHRSTAVIAAFIFLICSIYGVLSTKLSLPNTGFAHIILMCLFCLSTWVMFDIFSFKNKPKEFFNYSFMMFALNFYLGVYISRILYLILPKIQYFCLVNLIITLLLEIGFIGIASFFLKKYFPKTYSLLTGGR